MTEENKEEIEVPAAFKLSKQALTTIMMCLQNGLINRTDITEELANLVFEPGTSESEPSEVKLYVQNPPKVKLVNTIENDD